MYVYVSRQVYICSLTSVCILEQISNAAVFNFKYFSSDISYQAYFSYVSVWGYEKAFIRKEVLNSYQVTSSDEISWN